MCFAGTITAERATKTNGRPVITSIPQQNSRRKTNRAEQAKKAKRQRRFMAKSFGRAQNFLASEREIDTSHKNSMYLLLLPMI